MRALSIPTALVALACLAPAARAQGTYDLEIREVQGDLVASLRARNARVEEVLADVAKRTDKKLVGIERLGKTDPLSAELVERPLNQVLYTIAGCADARVRVNPTTIEVFSDLGGGASVEELEEQATVAYLRALQAHPEHALGAHAELVLGEIQERHGNRRAAVGHYELVARNFPIADEVPESLWRAGKLLEELGEWTGGVAKFRALSNLDVEHVYASRARLELAHCLVRTGDARQAQLLLDALDNLYPTVDRAETRGRLFVHAMALRATGRDAEAMRALAEADRMGVEARWEAPAAELRAQVLEAFDRPAEAARAWLAFAKLDVVAPKDQERAFVNAARLAQAAGDPLAVLMIERTASGTAAASAIAPIAAGARAELGLAAPTPASRLEAALDKANAWIAAHLAHQAVQALEAPWRERESLEEKDLLALAATYARALDEDKGVDAALDALRDVLRVVPSPAGKAAIHVVAGELYEKHERYEAAARAYGGDL